MIIINVVENFVAKNSSYKQVSIRYNSIASLTLVYSSYSKISNSLKENIFSYWDHHYCRASDTDNYPV
jgi:hypothetical protein